MTEPIPQTTDVWASVANEVMRLTDCCGCVAAERKNGGKPIQTCSCGTAATRLIEMVRNANRLPQRSLQSDEANP